MLLEQDCVDLNDLITSHFSFTSEKSQNQSKKRRNTWTETSTSKKLSSPNKKLKLIKSVNESEVSNSEWLNFDIHPLLVQQLLRNGFVIPTEIQKKTLSKANGRKVKHLVGTSETVRKLYRHQ